MCSIIKVEPIKHVSQIAVSISNVSPHKKGSKLEKCPGQIYPYNSIQKLSTPNDTPNNSTVKNYCHPKVSSSKNKVHQKVSFDQRVPPQPVFCQLPCERQSPTNAP